MQAPPHSADAERAVLCGMLLSRDAADEAASALEAADFHLEKHRLIFEAAAALGTRGIHVDALTVKEHLNDRRLLERAGGYDYLSELLNAEASAAGTKHYARIVKEKSVRRRIIAVARDVANAAAKEPGTAEDLMAMADGAFMGTLGEAPVDMETAREVGERFLRDLNDRILHGAKIPGLTTGMSVLDNKINGLTDCVMHVVGGKTSDGKTALALQWMAAAVRESGKSALYFSGEMPNDDLFGRGVAADSGVPYFMMKRGDLEGRGKEVTEAVRRMQELPIAYMNTSGMDIRKVTSISRRVASVGVCGRKLGLIVLDYLQLLRGEEDSQNREREVASISIGMKRIADRLRIPVVVLSQFSRFADRKDGPPDKSDLRDCLDGDAEIFDADTGRMVPVRDVVQNDMRFNVYSVDGSYRSVRRRITDAWRVGRREVVEVETRSGRKIRCTQGHRFMVAIGWSFLGSGHIRSWMKAGDLSIGDAVAVLRETRQPEKIADQMEPDKATLLGWLIGDGHLRGSAALTVGTMAEAMLAAGMAEANFGVKPSVKRERIGTAAFRVVMTTGKQCGAGKNPMTTWLRKVGAWGLVGKQKRVPKMMFSQTDYAIAGFLRGLFHADGSASRKAGGTTLVIRLSTISEGLAYDVQRLLTRFGIQATVSKESTSASGFRSSVEWSWTVRIGDRVQVVEFMDRIGFLGEKNRKAVDKLVRYKGNDAGIVDRLPIEVSRYVDEKRRKAGMSHAALGWRAQGKRMSRGTAMMVAEKLGDRWLMDMARGDVAWDEVRKVTKLGERDVYDVMVETTHNFVVDGFVTHNSGAIEHDAGVIVLLWRPNPPTKKGAPAVKRASYEGHMIVDKNRNGPTGLVAIKFDAVHGRFTERTEEEG